MSQLSVVVPVLNEEESVTELVRQIDQALAALDYELIIVNDGSTDRTEERVLSCAHPRLQLVSLTRNFGQTAAITAGIEQAQGEFIATLDGDLQNDPKDLPRLLELLKAGDWDLVTGYRQNRQDGVLARKVPSKIANYLIRRLTGVRIRDLGCTIRIFRSPFAKNLGLYGELHRFIPILAALQGAKILEVAVSHHARRFGSSKYGIGRTTRVISDLFLVLFLQRYLLRPIHIFGPLGLVCGLSGTTISLYLLGVRLMGEPIWGRPLMIMGAVLLLAGLHFLTFGILLDLQMRTYFESQGKRPYIIRRRAPRAP